MEITLTGLAGTIKQSVLIKVLLGGCPRIERSTAEKLFWSYFPIILVK